MHEFTYLKPKSDEELLAAEKEFVKDFHSGAVDILLSCRNVTLQLKSCRLEQPLSPMHIFYKPAYLFKFTHVPSNLPFIVMLYSDQLFPCMIGGRRTIDLKSSEIFCGAIAALNDQTRSNVTAVEQ